MVSTSLAPASAEPETTAADFSTALIRSSPATAAITGAPGARVSTWMTCVTAAEALPAASTAFTESVSAPWPIVAMSAAVSV